MHCTKMDNGRGMVTGDWFLSDGGVVGIFLHVIPIIFPSKCSSHPQLVSLIHIMLLSPSVDTLEQSEF